MADRYHSCVSSGNQGPSSSNVETFTFRVEPSSIPVFITKLCLMLDDRTLCEMISWSSDGKRFCVYDIPGFSKMVLPQYFKHSNWPSFVRQLNMYGFHKVNDSFTARNGQLLCEFHHPMFYRNGRLALRKIRRNSRKSVSSSVDPQTLHSSQQSSLQHPQQEQQQYQQQPPQHQQQPPQHYQHHQHQPQQHHQHRCQKQASSSSSPSYQPESSIVSFSIPTSSMPISSLLSSSDNDYTITPLDSTTDNAPFGMDISHDDNHNGKHGIRDIDNRNIIGSNMNAFDIDNKSITTDTSISINRNYSHGGHIKRDKGKRVVDDRIEYHESQDNVTDDSNSVAPLGQQYTEIRQQLDLLQSSATNLNSEMSFLKRYVAKQQELVMNLLNCLSTIIDDSEPPGLINQKQHQTALKALQIRSDQDVSSRKRNNTIDNEKNDLYHHHHHYYHLYHRPNHQINNGSFDGLDDDAIRYIDNNNDSSRERTKDTLHKLKEKTKPAKNDHHMHIHPLDNNKENTTLDNNKHDKHNNSQSNSHRSTPTTATESSIPPLPTTIEMMSPTIPRSPENG